MSLRPIFLGFGVGVAVGAGGCYLYLTSIKRPELRRVVLSRGLEETEHAAKRFGLPETDIVREYEGFIAAYDYRTRNPKWVLEHLSEETSNGSGNRDGSEFHPDPGVEPRFSAKLSDFRGSGFDRGHMAPAADHKGSQKAMDETFSLINISPQVGAGFNRDYWARFERFVKELTWVAGDVYVATGPLWLPTLEQQPRTNEIGSGGSGASSAGGGSGGAGKWTLTHGWIGKPPGLVAVPTHYYKVVVADPRVKTPARDSKGDDSKRMKGDAVAVGAFVMPNQPIDPRVPLSAYVVPLDALEQVAGIRFFPELLADDRRRTALDVAAIGWQQQGQAQLKPFDRVTMKQAYAALPAFTSATSSMVIDVEPVSSSSSAAATSAPARTSSDSPSLPSPPVPKTPGGAGVVHLCDVNSCQLPRQDWYKGKNSGGGGGDGGNTSSGGRTPSSRARRD